MDLGSCLESSVGEMGTERVHTQLDSVRAVATRAFPWTSYVQWPAIYGERVLTMVQAQRALDEMGEGSFENWMGTGGGSVSSREE